MREFKRYFVLALAAASLVAESSAQSLTYPVREVGGLRAIRARFRGRTGWFVLSTERGRTSVSNAFEANAPAEAVADGNLPTLDSLSDVRGLPETAMDAQGVFGVLGQDFFQGRRVEFDLVGNTVTISPSTGKAQAGDVPLERTAQGTLGTRVRVAGREAWALFASGKAEVLLSPELAKAVPGAVVGASAVYDANTGGAFGSETRLTDALRSKLVGSLWVGFRETTEAETKGYEPKPDVFLPLTAFGASRVAIDFGAATLHLTPRSEDARIGLFANDLVRRPLAFREGRLYLPAVSSPFPEKEDLEIVGIGGVGTPEIVKAIREGGEANRKLLADLVRKGLEGQKLVVLHDGERVEITAEKRP